MNTTFIKNRSRGFWLTGMALLWLLALGACCMATAEAATATSRATGNWNAGATWQLTRTGTITANLGNPNVTGAGTAFTTELAVGNVIMNAAGAVIGTVQSITNNTSLVLTANAAVAVPNAAYTAQRPPLATDAVVIANLAHTVTVTANASATTMTFTTGNQNATVLINSGFGLTLTGLTINGNTAAIVKRVDLAAGATTLTVNGNVTLATTVATATAEIRLGSNASTLVDINGTLTANSGGESVNFLGAGTLRVSGNYTGGGTFTRGTGTVIYDGAAAQSVGAYGYNNLTIANTAAATCTLAGATTVNGALLVSSPLATGGNTMNVIGGITGANATTSIWTNSTNSTLNITGPLLATGVLNTSASGNTIDFRSAANQTIKQASGNQYFNLTFSNGGTDSFPTAGSTQNILGNLTINTGATLSANTNDNILNVTGNMVVTGTYLASNTAGRTLTVTGNLTVGGTFTGNTAPVNLAGNFTHNGTFTSGAGAFTFTGAVAQVLDGTATNTTFTTMGMGNTAAFANRKLTLSHDITVTTLNFSAVAATGGRIVTGANKVIVPTGGAINNASGSATESDFISGRLQRFVAAGASTVAFPVGTDGAALPAAGYSPASLAFTGVGVGGGSLIVSATQGDHPNVATSGLDSAKSVNRYWTLTTAGVSGTALPPFTNYAATLTFIGGAAPPGDLDSGANTANFEMERWTGAAWDTTTVGARTATTTTATETALGDLAVAEKKVIIPDPGNFNAFETSTAANSITGRVFTKLVGTNFSLDVVAILAGAQHATFTNTVTVDLVTGSTGGLNCPGTPVAIAGSSQSVNLNNGRGTTGAFNIAGTAYRDVRVRVRYPTSSPTVTSCSTDNFAIRPTGLTVTSTNASGGTAATNTAVSGTPAIKTGANFNLRATALPGYDGTPSINNALVTGTPTAGTIGGSFSAAASGSGIADGNAFYYSEVGNFGLGTNAVFDSGFTSIDSGGGDCTNDFSNALVGGRYGCNFGSTAVTQTTGVSGFGRFIPDNFNVGYNVPVIAPACTGFSYVGQTFNYSTAPVMTITARNGTNNGLTNATTVNYAGSYMKFTNASLSPAAYDTQAERYARFDALGGGNTPALDVTSLPATTADPVISAFAAGVGTLTFSGGSGFRLTRSTTTPSAAFDADIALALNVIDADGVTFAGNPASFGTTTAGSGIIFSGNAKQMRYGRLYLGNVSGSQQIPLRVPVEAQYWNGTAFITNTLDNCTALAAGNVGLGNYLGNLGAGETTASIVNSPLQSGHGAIQLSAPGAGNQGSVDVALNLGGGAAADACAGFAPAATAGNLAHLRGRWCNPPGTYAKDPSARARFGVSRGSDQTIYRREQ